MFHAGTAMDAQGQLVAAGGRVLSITALGDSVAAAQKQAYQVRNGCIAVHCWRSPTCCEHVCLAALWQCLQHKANSTCGQQGNEVP